MASNRPDYAIRVLQGLLALGNGGKHLTVHIDKACELACASGDYTLGSIKRNLAQLESSPGSILKQDEFPFLEEHPLIRPLTEYRDLLGSHDL